MVPQQVLPVAQQTLLQQARPLGQQAPPQQVSPSLEQQVVPQQVRSLAQFDPVPPHLQLPLTHSSPVSQRVSQSLQWVALVSRS